MPNKAYSTELDDKRTISELRKNIGIIQNAHSNFYSSEARIILDEFSNYLYTFPNKISELYALEPSFLDSALHNSKIIISFLNNSRDSLDGVVVSEFINSIWIFTYHFTIFYDLKKIQIPLEKYIEELEHSTDTDIYKKYSKLFSQADEDVMLLKDLQQERNNSLLEDTIEEIKESKKEVKASIQHFEKTINNQIIQVTENVTKAFETIIDRKKNEVFYNTLAIIFFATFTLSTIIGGYFCTDVFKINVIPNAVKELKKVETAITAISPALEVVKTQTRKFNEQSEILSPFITLLAEKGSLSIPQSMKADELVKEIVPIKAELTKLKLDQINPTQIHADLKQIEETLTQGSLYIPIIFERLAFVILLGMELFFLKVLLKNYFAARDELLQLELRKTLCLYAPSYKAFMNKDAKLLEFTEHIFTRLDHKIIETPDPLESIEKITPLIKAMQEIQTGFTKNGDVEKSQKDIC